MTTRELDPGNTMGTNCRPCGMCAGAIERSGLGRVVFALSDERLAGPKPDDGGRPHVPQEGPALSDEARGRRPPLTGMPVT